jgi:hypothetical protein
MEPDRGHAAAAVRQVRMFFFEKKNQKTFAPKPVPVSPARTNLAKVFLLLFFQKKKFLLSSRPAQ